MNEIERVLKDIDRLEAERKFPQALEKAHEAMRKHADARALRVKLAHLYETCKQYDQAIGMYVNIHEATQQASGKTELPILVGLVNSQIHKSRYDQAGKILEQLIAVAPNHPDVLSPMAHYRRHKGDLADAERLLKKALKAAPDHKQARHELAEVYLAKKDPDSALPLLEKNFRRKDMYGDSIDLWLKTLGDQNRNRYAQDVMEELARKFPNSVEFVYGFGVLANRAGEITLARPAFEKAMELSPNNARIIYELGVLERIAGNLDRSQELIGKSLDIKPDSPAAIRTYNSDLKLAYGDDNFKRLNYVAANLTDFPEIEQVHLHYALAKAFEDVEELDTAFRHYAIAGNKKRKLETYNEKEASRLTQVIPQVVTKKRLAETEQTGCPSEVPVFILGMPRSGTSLMEQILSAHPDIFGAGELKILTGVLENIPVAKNRLRLGEKDPVFPYEDNAPWDQRGEKYVERIRKLADRGDYKRIVDKMPGNFNFVGLIHAILPNAKIIHSRRHPVETCLSCYRIHFAEGHQWTYNLRELGRFYRRYWNLMQYWREEFPGVMYEAVYEENVNDVETSARKLIDFLGLPWNERCLEFYNVDRPVKTASVTQVRKPIYKTSTNRWRKYERFLEPLLDEIGDIVEEYEAGIAHLIEK
jgi:tetratricopeptide (TPR) repeat protein